MGLGNRMEADCSLWSRGGDKTRATVLTRTREIKFGYQEDLFHSGGVRCWKRLPREDVEAFKTRSDRVLAGLIQTGETQPGEGGWAH